MGILDTVTTGIFINPEDANQDGLPTLGPSRKNYSRQQQRHPRYTQDLNTLQLTPKCNGGLHCY